MTLDETIRRCYYNENLSISEIMSAYKINYWIVMESIRKGPI